MINQNYGAVQDTGSGDIGSVTEHPKGVGRLIIKIAIVIVVCAAGFWGYATYGNPFFGKTSEQIMQLSFNRTYNSLFVDESAYNTALDVSHDIKIDTLLPNSTNHNVTHVKIPIQLNIEKGEGISEYNIQTMVKDIDFTDLIKTFEFPTTGKEILNFETRVFSKEKKIYIKINSIPQIAREFSTMFGISNLDILMKDWMNIDFAEVDSLAGTHDVTNLTHEQVKDLTRVTVDVMMSPEISSVTTQKVPEGMSVSYVYDYKEFQQALVDLDKKVRDIVGDTSESESEIDINPNEDGTISLTVIVNKDMELVRIESSSHINYAQRNQVIDTATVIDISTYDISRVEHPKDTVLFKDIFGQLIGR